MFLTARYTYKDLRAVRIFRAQVGMSRLQPVGAAAAATAAVVQVADILRT